MSEEYDALKSLELVAAGVMRKLPRDSRYRRQLREALDAVKTARRRDELVHAPADVRSRQFKD